MKTQKLKMTATIRKDKLQTWIHWSEFVKMEDERAIYPLNLFEDGDFVEITVKKIEKT